jgi:triosephosphate isomerase (TIM)
MNHYTIVGNWKMNQTPDQAVRLVKNLQKKLKPQTHVTTVVCPPYLDLIPVKEAIEPDVLKIGAQNIHSSDEGAFTGEISGPMLDGLAEYVIVGHSERRREEHETDKVVASKLAAAVRNDIKPILCVGEKLSDREDGHSGRVVVDQLRGSLAQLTDDDIPKLTIAYEPVWAIGTGKFAKPEDVAKIITIIRQTIEELYGEAASSRIEILYGGSVDSDNAKAYLKLENVNGLLVGGASLNYESFAKISETAAALTK